MTTEASVAVFASDSPLIARVADLRWRIIRVMITVMCGAVVGLYLVLGPMHLMRVLVSHFASDPNHAYPPVQALGVTEAFVSSMDVALSVGVALALPMIVYQLIGFIAPQIDTSIRRLLYLGLPLVTLCFVLGAAFGWFITIPTTLHFLLTYADATIRTQPTLHNFVDTILWLLLINGAVFEVPLIIVLLARLQVVTVAQLTRVRRFAVLAASILAALITPTNDVGVYLTVAVPMYLLYEVGILCARLGSIRTHKLPQNP